MSLRGWLLVATAPLALALAVLGSFAVTSLAGLGHSTESILADNYRSVLAVQRMKDALEQLDDCLLESAIGAEGDTASSAAGLRHAFEHELVAQERNLTEPGEGEVTAALRAAWSAYLGAWDRCSPPSDPAGRRRCYAQVVAPERDAVRRAAERVLVLNQDAMLRKSDAARREARRRAEAMPAAAVLALAAGVAATLVLAGRILRPLRVFGQAVEQFGAGDFAVRAGVRGHDEIAQLAATFNAMADRIEEYRKSSLGELVQAQLATQAAIDALPDPVFQFAIDGSLIASNEAASALVGPGANLENAPAEVRDAVAAVRDHALQGKGAFVGRGLDEAVAVPANGGGPERSFVPNATPVYEEGLGVVGAAVVLRDVTALRRLDALRTDLVATVAHQFRTPLTSLRMAIHLCLDGVAGPLAPKQEELLHAAREECERLQQLVDEILDLARLQAGGVGLAPERLDADALLASTRREHEPAAATRAVTLVCDPAAPDLALFADRARLGVVLSNLVENAIRHSPAGGRVVLRARAADHGARLEVEDEGPGVPEQDRGRIFEKYVRAGGIPGATGLGLAIAREIVTAHGGTIGVGDAPSGGACFWLELPAPPGERR